MVPSHRIIVTTFRVALLGGEHFFCDGAIQVPLVTERIMALLADDAAAGIGVHAYGQVVPQVIRGCCAGDGGNL